jgi:hypothetical protein
MRNPFLAFLLAMVVSGSVFAQAVMTTSGNWATAGNWTAGNIGNVVTETVTINNGVNPTVFSGSNLTVGATSLVQNNTLTINSGGTLNIGDATHANGITTNNNANITVAGTLVIWGDLQVNNNIVWNITGTVIIKGNVVLNNNANLNVTGGTLSVGGNFTGGNNTNVSVPSGSITVGGTVDVGNGSNLSGCAGCFHSGGSCTGPASFCSNSVLPITLLTFEGKAFGSVITLEWTTATELNFDRFVVERSGGGHTFSEIGSVAGHGTGNELNDYSFNDEMPLEGSNYYRLRSLDLNGGFVNSSVVKVDLTEAAERIKLYPNPVTNGTFSVMTNFARQDGDRIVIYNNVGETIGERDVDLGEIVVREALGSGMYTLCYLSASQRYMVRFVVK